MQGVGKEEKRAGGETNPDQDRTIGVLGFVLRNRPGEREA
jgi:hypothetical protein